MSMNPQQDDFQDLRRLLALKRHEQPPPGYFEGFSRQVIARIQAGDYAEQPAAAGWLLTAAPWLQRFWVMLESKPILVGAFGAAVCALLIAGLNYSEDGAVPSGLLPLADASPAQTTESAAPAAAMPLLAHTASVDLSTTGGVVSIESRPSLFQEFDQRQKPWVVPASYQALSGGTSPQ